jgi:phosphonopyruvate decarboxylase
MQNSGIGNAVNPLLSLAAPEVYSVPMLLVVGYRGEPGKPDEPQHVKQGEVTESLLQTLGIPFSKIANNINDVSNTEEMKSAVTKSVKHMKETGSAYALIISKGTFDKSLLPVNSELSEDEDYLMLREKALEIIVASLHVDDLVVSTTGMTSRELWEIRKRKNQDQKDFLVVGGMGHCSQITLSVALAHPERKVFCIDGDGSALMHMGSVALIGKNAPDNLIHIIMNNGAHESVGGHPTLGRFVDFSAVFKACGYKKVKQVKTEEALSAALVSNSVSRSGSMDGPFLLEILVRAGHRKDLGRPDKSTKSIKDSFMKHCIKSGTGGE